MSTQEDIDTMIRKVDGRLAGHTIPPGELVFRSPGTLDAETEQPIPLTFANVEDLRRFVREEVHKALDELATQMRNHAGLRMSRMAKDEG